MLNHNTAELELLIADPFFSDVSILSAGKIRNKHKHIIGGEIPLVVCHHCFLCLWGLNFRESNIWWMCKYEAQKT